MYRQWQAGDIEYLLPFFNTDLLANVFYDIYLNQHESYIRVILHPQSSIQTFVTIKEQFHIFEKMRREHAFQTLGILCEVDDDLRFPEMAFRERFAKLACRPQYWIELWATDSTENDWRMGELMEDNTPSHKGTSGVMDAVNDNAFRVSVATPCANIPEGNIIKIFLLGQDSARIIYTLRDRVIRNNRDTLLVIPQNVVCHIGQAGIHVNRARIKHPRKIPLIYLNRTLTIVDAYDMLGILNIFPANAMYFAVLPRSSPTPLNFLSSGDAVLLDMRRHLDHRTIFGSVNVHSSRNSVE